MRVISQWCALVRIRNSCLSSFTTLTKRADARVHARTWVMSDLAIAHLTHRFKGTREKKSANEPFSWQDADKLEVEWTETGMAYVARVEQSDHCFAFVHSPKPFKSVVTRNYFHNVQRELGIRTTF